MMGTAMNWRFPDQVLKGIGQVMLQENRWTGLLFLLGLFSGHWTFGLAALCAAAAGTAMARLLKYPSAEIDEGLYGFSPALVGVALVAFFQPILLLWAVVPVGGAAAAVLQHLFIRRKVAAYTFPFIVVAWASIFLLRQYAGIPASATVAMEKGAYWPMATNGFGQVIFQGGILAGLLFFCGVLWSNRKAALYGLGASMLGAVAALATGQSAEHVQAGLFGFNAVLTAIALAGRERHDFPWMLAGVVLTVVLHLLLVNSHLLDGVGGVLTFPFVAATWAVLLVRRSLPH